VVVHICNPEHGRQRQEDGEFKVSLVYIARLCFKRRRRRRREDSEREH
jgi:hypothetical protein